MFILQSPLFLFCLASYLALLRPGGLTLHQAERKEKAVEAKKLPLLATPEVAEVSAEKQQAMQAKLSQLDFAKLKKKTVRMEVDGEEQEDDDDSEEEGSDEDLDASASASDEDDESEDENEDEEDEEESSDDEEEEMVTR